MTDVKSTRRDGFEATRVTYRPRQSARGARRVLDFVWRLDQNAANAASTLLRDHDRGALLN